jgi:hypothetical protein
LDCGVHVLRIEVIVVLETLEASPMQPAPRLRPIVLPAPEQVRTIALSVEVDADARRISQALTEPEYLEAWICMPDHTGNSQIVASKREDGYRLDQIRAGCFVASFIGSFLFCHQRKMRLSWRDVADPGMTESLVDFRIRGNFASSIIELRHTALPSPREFFWHQQLWGVSLDRLATILRFA